MDLRACFLQVYGHQPSVLAYMELQLPTSPADLSAGIDTIAISNGVVVLHVSEALAGQPIILRLRNLEVPFERLGAQEAGAAALAVGLRPVMPAAAGAPSGAPRFDAAVNAIRDWVPQGLHSLQVRILDRASPLRIRATDPLLVPASPAPLWFEAGLANHRARGRLAATLHLPSAAGTSSGVPRLARFELERGRFGGGNTGDFQKVRWVIPARSDDAELTLDLEYEGYDATAADPDPYLMLLDPRVTTGSAVPIEMVRTPAGTRQGTWISAPLPDLMAPGDPLLVALGGRELPLKIGASCSVWLQRNEGHTIVLHSSDLTPLQVRLDGEPVRTGPIGPDGVPVLLPHRFLTGQTRRLDVVDEGATQALLATHVVTPRLITPREVLQAETSPPLPDTLFPQAAHRFSALRRQLEAGIDPAAQRQVAWALAALEAGPQGVELRPLVFPGVENPIVSVVIPAHNHIRDTYLTLCSLLLAHNRRSLEVIVVDDGSTDATANLEDLVSGIAVVRHERPQRFIRACNAGAAQARGRYLALLNNDVEVTEGWADALVEAFERFGRVGLAGSKLVYPDGRLQEAGGIVWGSGNPWNYGRGESPWDPRFCYARQADYLSGAALMASREAWDRVGGLSSDLEPMYFEDTDLAFKVREAGYSTWFVPASVVYHYEGVTSGTDTSSGFKRFQEVNRPKFKRRWAQAYRAHGREGEAPDLEKDRGIAGRVLFIDYAVPRPDRDAGGYAAVQEIRLMQSLGYKVTVLPRNLAHLGRYTDDLGRMGVEAVHAPFALSVADFIKARGPEFDAVYVTRYHVALDVLELLRRHAPQARVLLNNADLHFLREMRAGLAAGDAEALARARETRELELGAMGEADVVLSYNEVEHSLIESHTEGRVKVVTCPWVVHAPAAVAPLAGREGLSFLGNFNHAPNLEAVEWLRRHVLPRLEGAGAGLALHVYGAAMPAALRDLAAPDLVVEGFVEDVGSAYDRHRIFVAPLQSGAGIKGKVLGAMAHGIPSVLSPVAAEGIGLRHRTDCLIARTPEEWAAAIAELRADDALWEALSGTARAYVAERFSFARGRELMRRAFEAADLYPPPG